MAGLLALLLIASSIVAGPFWPAAAATPVQRTVLVVGDSLSAEYGLPRGTGWVALLSARLQQQGAKYSVVNASISGETTSGGRTRLPSLLSQHRPAIVVIELGANDGLRGLSLSAMRENLDAMAAAAAAGGARVLIVGMRLPPNYGAAYVDRFHAAFEAVAKMRHAAFVPFLMEGFADQRDLFQADTIHPTAAAQPRLLENVWPALSPMLAAAGAAGH